MAGARKIIIDTDPGQDDAAAIMLALGSPDELEVLGITTVAGNVPLALTSKNARITCDFAGRKDIKVYAGCEKPIKKALITAEHVHGATGLDGPELFEPETPLQPQHAVDFIIETLRNEPSGTVTLCPLGALTNIATALTRAPDIAGRVQEIVLMGGAYFEVGNITPAAEFNIYVDPEAAEIVFKSGIPIVMIPLDLTHKVLTRKARVNRIRALGIGHDFADDALRFRMRIENPGVYAGEHEPRRPGPADHSAADAGCLLDLAHDCSTFEFMNFDPA